MNKRDRRFIVCLVDVVGLTLDKAMEVITTL